MFVPAGGNVLKVVLGNIEVHKINAALLGAGRFGSEIQDQRRVGIISMEFDRPPRLHDQLEPDNRQNLAANLLIERIKQRAGLGADAYGETRKSSMCDRIDVHLKKYVSRRRQNDRLFYDISHSRLTIRLRYSLPSYRHCSHLRAGAFFCRIVGPTRFYFGLAECLRRLYHRIVLVKDRLVLRGGWLADVIVTIVVGHRMFRLILR
jgi:hypothetical protein